MHQEKVTSLLEQPASTFWSLVSAGLEMVKKITANTEEETKEQKNRENKGFYAGIAGGIIITGAACPSGKRV